MNTTLLWVISILLYIAIGVMIADWIMKKDGGSIKVLFLFFWPIVIVITVIYWIYLLPIAIVGFFKGRKSNGNS